VDPEEGCHKDRAMLMATSARFRWPSTRDVVSAYAHNLMAANKRRQPTPTSPTNMALNSRSCTVL